MDWKRLVVNVRRMKSRLVLRYLELMTWVEGRICHFGMMSTTTFELRTNRRVLKSMHEVLRFIDWKAEFYPEGR